MVPVQNVPVVGDAVEHEGFVHQDADMEVNVGNPDLDEGNSDDEDDPAPVNIAGEEDEEDAVEDDDDGMEEEDELDGNEAMYHGAPLSVKESLVMVLALMLNHSLTGSCIADILTVINLHCPRPGLKRLSLYHFRKFFSCSRAALQKKYYCSECMQSLNTPQDICGVCGRARGVSYFVQLPILPQLKELYKRQSFYQNLQHRFNRNVPDGCLTDIYDAEFYREQVGRGFLADPNNISLTWYTDGIPVFNSKNYSIWPFCFICNELPYKLRLKRENILLAGLWFGPHKPAANLFMNSFVPDLRRLYNGVHITTAGMPAPLFVRGIVLAGVCDTPAKSQFLNFVSHVGFHGCPACEIRGETLQRVNETDKHVYRYQQPLISRTKERIQQQAREAINSPDPVVGVKGPTVLRLFMTDFLRGTALDAMHLVTGVVKKLLKLHFSAKCSFYQFSVRAVLGVADLELLNIKPPQFIHRKPWSLEHYNRWKASQLKAWLFYYSLAIYKNILRPDYFDHYLKFVVAISYLSADTVSHEMINTAEGLLKEFVRDFEVLYDLKFCSINIHLLLHLADCVRQLGPLQIYSCYPMENMNGLMLNTIHGKTNVDSQVCRSFWQFMTLTRKLENTPDGPVKDFCIKRRRSLRIRERIADSCYVVGLCKDEEANHPLILRGLEAANIARGRISLYFRLLKNSQVYVAEKYTRCVNSISSYVAFESETGTQIGSIYTFIKIARCVCNGDCRCEKEHYAIIRVAEKVDGFRILNHPNVTLKYINQYRMSLVVKAVPVASLKTVCVYVAAFNTIHISQPVNSLEVE